MRLLAMVANTLITVTVLFALSLGNTMAQSSSGSAAPESDASSPSRKTQARAVRSPLAPTTLARRDGPLREQNISDIEIRQIEGQVKRVYPGSLLNISGVTTGCPCENGPLCSEQVWVVAHQTGRVNGLSLSRIAGRWTIGPLQQWWLEYDRLRARTRQEGRLPAADARRRLKAFIEARRDLWDRYPRCAAADSLAQVVD